jgi:hypothetical protein
MFEQYPQESKSPAESKPPATKPVTTERDFIMLSPAAAWRSLCARTGGSIAKVTFYRWLRNGKVYSIRLGQRIFIPQAALDDLVTKCLDGEKY